MKKVRQVSDADTFALTKGYADSSIPPEVHLQSRQINVVKKIPSPII